MRCLESSYFVDTIKETINRTVEETGVYDFDISAASMDSRDLQLAGTFQAALHMKILNAVSTMFGRIISFVDKNSNMGLSLDSFWAERWVLLFRRAFSINSTNSKPDEMYAVISDGHGGDPFHAMYPFSFYMSSVFDSMRRAYEFQPELTLRSQLEMVSLETFQGEQDDRSMEAYTFDVCSIKFKEIKRYSRELLAKTFARILLLIAVEDNQSIEKLRYFSQVHYYLWRGERLIELYFELFAGNIGKIEVLTDYLTATARGFNDTCHRDIILRFVNELMPWNCWKLVGDESATRQQLNEWIDQVDHVKTTVLSIIDLIKDESMKSECFENWSSLALFQVFVRDLGIPLELNIPVLLGHISRLRDKPLVSRDMLSSLIKVLEGINIEILRQNLPGFEKYICPISLERFVFPVIAPDGITYEKSAIEAWINAGHQTSPVTRAPCTIFTLRPNLALLADIQQANECDLSRFLEYYVFDVIFSQNRRKLESFSDLISDLVVLSSGRSPVPAEKEHYMNGVLPSAAACRGIIRELYKLSDPVQQRRVADLINEELLRTRDLNHKLLDSSFFVSVISVEEEQMAVPPEPKSIDLLPIGNLSRPDVVPRQVVDSVAAIRLILRNFAKSLCNLDKDDAAEAASIEALSNSVSFILESSAMINEKVTRQIRMLLLKIIERERGQSFVRGILMKNPIKSSVWLNQWLESSDVSISQFVGKDRLPRTNPFLPIPLYRECKEAFNQYLTSGNLERLEQELTGLVASSGSKDPFTNLRPSLLSALFSEVSLLSVLPTHLGESLMARINALISWCASAPFISKVYNPTEKAIILLLCTGRNSSNVLVPVFTLGPDSSTDQILQIRLAVHVFATVMSASETNPMAFLKSLVNEPSKCIDSYFPTMPEDLTKMAQNVLGGRFYACPNGHPFYVDACGGPTMKGRCFCGEEIGGLDHNLLATNKRIDGLGAGLFQKSNLEDKSEKNYCIRTVPEEQGDRFSSRRGINAVSLRVIRLIMHTLMYCTSCATSGSYDTQAKRFFNSSYSDPVNVNAFLQEHYSTDWSYLTAMLTRSVDDVSLVLHLILLNASGIVIPDTSAQQNVAQGSESVLASAARSLIGGMMSMASNVSRLASSGEAAAPTAAGGGGAVAQADYRTLPTLESRIKWEKVVAGSFIAEVLDKDIGAVLTSAAAKLGDGQGGEISIFTTELLDKYNVEDLSTEDRLASSPGLWRYAKGFSLEHFSMSLQLVPTSSQRFPVLSSFMTDEIQLRGLRYLPGIDIIYYE